MLNKKASEKVDKVLKELVKVLEENNCWVQTKGVHFNENFEGNFDGHNISVFDLDINIGGNIDYGL